MKGSRLLLFRRCALVSEATSNNGMHPTAGTLLVIFARGAAAAGDARVRLLLRYKHSADGMRRRGRARSDQIKVSPAMTNGLTSMAAGGGGHAAG